MKTFWFVLSMFYLGHRHDGLPFLQEKNNELFYLFWIEGSTNFGKEAYKEIVWTFSMVKVCMSCCVAILKM